MWICSSGLYIVPEKAAALAAESSHYVFVPGADWLLIKRSRILYRLSWITALYICIPSWKLTQSGYSCILPRCLLVSDALGDCREDLLLYLYTLAFIRMVSIEISSISLKRGWNWNWSWGWKLVHGGHQDWRSSIHMALKMCLAHVCDVGLQDLGWVLGLAVVLRHCCWLRAAVLSRGPWLICWILLKKKNVAFLGYLCHSCMFGMNTLLP